MLHVHIFFVGLQFRLYFFLPFFIVTLYMASANVDGQPSENVGRTFILFITSLSTY